MTWNGSWFAPTSCAISCISFFSIKSNNSDRALLPSTDLPNEFIKNYKKVLIIKFLSHTYMIVFRFKFCRYGNDPETG